MLRSRLCPESAALLWRPASDDLATATNNTAATRDPAQRALASTRAADKMARTALWVDRVAGATLLLGPDTVDDQAADIVTIDHAARSRYDVTRACGERRSLRIAQGAERTRSRFHDDRGNVGNDRSNRVIRRFLKRFQAPAGPCGWAAADKKKRGAGPRADYLHLATFNEAERDAFDLSSLRAPPSTILQRCCARRYGIDADRHSHPHHVDILRERALALDALRAVHEDIALPETLTRYATRLLGRDNFFVMYRVDIRPVPTVLATCFGRSRCFIGIDPMLYSGDPTRDAADVGQDGDHDPLIGSASLRGAHYVFSHGIVNATEDDILRLYAIRADGIRAVSNAENFRYLDRAIDHPSGDALRDMDEMHLDPDPITSAHLYLLDCDDPAERRLIAELMCRLPYDIFGVPLRDFVAFEVLAKRHGHPMIDSYDFPEADAFFAARQ